MHYEAAWPVRKLALRCTPHAVAYLPDFRLYALATSAPQPWKEVEVGTGPLDNYPFLFYFIQSAHPPLPPSEQPSFLELRERLFQHTRRARRRLNVKGELYPGQSLDGGG